MTYKRVYKYNPYFVENGKRKRLALISYAHLFHKRGKEVPLFPASKVRNLNYKKDMDRIMSMFFHYVRDLALYRNLYRYNNKALNDSFYLYRIQGVKRLTKSYFVNKDPGHFAYDLESYDMFRNYVAYTIHSIYKNMTDYLGYNTLLLPMSNYTKSAACFMEFFSVFRGYNANRTYRSIDYREDGIYGSLIIGLDDNRYIEEPCYEMEDTANSLAYEFLYNAAKGRSRYM